MFLPFGLLLLWPVVLLAFGFIAVGAWQIHSWRTGAVGETGLVLGIVALLIAVCGRWITLGLLGRSGARLPEVRAEAKRVKTNDGADLHVEDSGQTDSPTVVLLHGWGQDAREWNLVRARLGNSWRVVAYDLRGHSRSGSPLLHAFDVERYAQDLDTVLARLRVERAVLVGHSFGGMTILEALRTKRPHVTDASAFVLVGTTPVQPLRSCAGAGLVSALEWPLIRPLLHLTVWLTPVVWLGQWLGYLNGSAHWVSFLSGFGRRPTRAVLDHATRTSVRQSPAVLARGALHMLRYDTREVLDDHAMPWWVVSGVRDRVTRHDLNAAMAARSEATLNTVPSGGHMTPLEDPDAVVDAIKRASGMVSVRPGASRSG